jgi:inosose dehydratase
VTPVPLAAPMAGPRLAGAPISWGVCEVPGWGYQLSAARVLADMRRLGLTATELGPDGFLPQEPAAAGAMLRAHHLTAVGGFTPVLLHVPGRDPVPAINQILDSYADVGAGVVVLSAVSGRHGYNQRPVLDDRGWATLVRNLDRLSALAAERGARAVLHPHVGTMIETAEEVERVLEASSISLCLDTGHLLIGGTDPAELARQAAERIAHAHFKDVDRRIAAQVRSGGLTYTEAVRAGMYRPLGDGDVDIAAIVGYLAASCYDGWYTLEQDTILSGEPPLDGKLLTDVLTSVEYIRTLLFSC